MQVAEAVYSLDPHRRRLFPYLRTLLEASNADRVGVFALTAQGVQPFMVLDTRSDVARTDFPERLIASGRAAIVGTRLRSGRDRPMKLASLYLAERRGVEWYLVLERHKALDLGIEIEHAMERAIWAGVLLASRVTVEVRDSTRTAQEMIAAGQTAEDQARYDEALDTYAEAREHALAVCEAVPAITAHWYHARVLRKLGRWNAAAHGYRSAAAVADAVQAGGLGPVIRVGEGTIERHRGNLRRAHEIYEGIVEEGDELARSRAKIGLLNLAHDTRDYREATRIAWEIFSEAPTERERWDAAVSVSDVLIHRGLYDLAIALARTVLAHTPRQDTATLATANIAVAKAALGDEAGFEAHVAGLALDDLPVHLRGEVLQDLAAAEWRLGRLDEAESRAVRALEFSEEARLGRLVFEAEDRLKLMIELQRRSERPDPLPFNEAEDGIRAQLLALEG